MTQQTVSRRWTELSGAARTLLYIVAHRERDNTPATCSDILDTVSTGKYPGITAERLLGTFQRLEHDGLIEADTPLDSYRLTTEGRELLGEHSVRVESVVANRAIDDVESLAVCPACGDPVTALLPATHGDLAANPCGCSLTPTADGSVLLGLLAAYSQITDADASYHLRQVIYLLLPREHD